jgi:hypothetical protein
MAVPDEWAAIVVDTSAGCDHQPPGGTVLERGAGLQSAWVVGISLVGLHIVGVTGSWGSPAGGAATSSMVAGAEPTRLDPVVVTGTQIAVPVSKLPSAITEAAGDRLDPLDPDQFSDRRRLVLSLRTTYAMTRWWEQVLLLGYNRIDFQFRDAFNPPADFGALRSDSDEQRLFLNYFWNMSLTEVYQGATTWSLGTEA